VVKQQKDMCRRKLYCNELALIGTVIKGASEKTFSMRERGGIGK